jgi:hypothetical protein
MPGSKQQAFYAECRKRLREFPTWDMYGNTPEYPWTVVFNDLLEIATQLFDKNDDLLFYEKKRGYHPRYTNVELEMLVGKPLDSKEEDMPFIINLTDTIPGGRMMYDLYKTKVLIRRKKTNGLLGPQKDRSKARASHDAVNVVKSKDRPSKGKRKKAEL